MGKKKPMMYKQVIVLRTDLGMSKGKAIAQGAHVSVLASLKAMRDTPETFQSWLDEGFTKIACKVQTVDDIYQLRYLSTKNDIPCAIVEDYGRTELEPGTVTAIAIGPALSEKVDEVTGNLKLL